MVAMSPPRPDSSTSVGGALVAASGLLVLVDLLSAGGPSVLAVVSAVALALGSGVLAFGIGGGSIVGRSRIGRLALLVFGGGPLLYLLPLERTPWPVLSGMSLIALITIATVVAAITVARSAVLSGVARWTVLVVAVDALVTAALSSVPLEGFFIVYLDWHLEFIRPLALLIWGLAIVLRGRSSAIRRRVATFDSAWRRSTDVGGAATEAVLEGNTRH